jgi:hypothetical protein
VPLANQIVRFFSLALLQILNCHTLLKQIIRPSNHFTDKITKQKLLRSFYFPPFLLLKLFFLFYYINNVIINCFILSITTTTNPNNNTMPRVSDRKRVLQSLEYEIECRKATSEALRVAAMADRIVKVDMDDVYADDDSSNGDMQDLYECNELLVDALELNYNEINAKRYLMERKSYRMSLRNMFDRDLEDKDNKDGSPPWLQEEEFPQKYRMHRESFCKLLDMIKEHPVFHTDGVKKQASVAHQLLLLLFYLGKSGSGSNNPTLRNMFQIGRGTPDSYKRRCITALRSLRESVICWPDDNERKDIAKRMFTQYDWVSCVGVLDGTLFPLTYPRSEDGLSQTKVSILIEHDNCK